MTVESEVSKFVLHLSNKKGAKFLCPSQSNKKNWSTSLRVGLITAGTQVCFFLCKADDLYSGIKLSQDYEINTEKHRQAIMRKQSSWDVKIGLLMGFQMAGLMLGKFDGASEGIMLGTSDGIILGMSDGIMLGMSDGIMLGTSDSLGTLDGIMLGASDGTIEGASDGVNDGTSESSKLS